MKIDYKPQSHLQLDSSSSLVDSRLGEITVESRRTKKPLLGSPLFYTLLNNPVPSLLNRPPPLCQKDKPR